MALTHSSALIIEGSYMAAMVKHPYWTVSINLQYDLAALKTGKIPLITDIHPKATTIFIKETATYPLSEMMLEDGTDCRKLPRESFMKKADGYSQTLGRIMSSGSYSAYKGNSSLSSLR